MSERESLFIWASTVNPNSPAAVGVPEISPVDASIARPAGSAPELTDHVFGSETVAVICKEYGVPTVPGTVPSGPSVSFGSPGTMGIMNS